MTGAFLRNLKRDYVCVGSKPSARFVLEQLPGWISLYHTIHPHRALATARCASTSPGRFRRPH